MTLELQQVNKQEALAAIEKLFDGERQGRVSFERQGDQFTIFATSAMEPTSS